jgi:2-phosphoglycerate kinase
MIYLIGGSPRSGKSKLAKIFAEKKSIPYFSADDLRPVIQAYLSKDSLEEKIPNEFMYANCNFDNDVYFEKYSAAETIETDLIDSHTLFTGIESLINHFHLTERDLIIEGVQLLPELVFGLMNKDYYAQIKIVYLVKTDAKKIRDDIEKNDPKSDWLLQNTKKTETLDKAANMLSDYGKYFTRESEKYGFALFNTENDFFDTLDKAETFLIH